ncbi:VC0807 family protein [Nocardia sp. NPDC006630]|uniref:VC0807 family protein n=1 Tax=Nocardia sp. NPDC006630 TaxID=3157181 RepID=UPI0033A42858
MTDIAVGQYIMTTDDEADRQTRLLPAQPGEQRPTERQKSAAARKALARNLILELGLPIGGYYGLHAAGFSQWVSVLGAGLLVTPAIGYTLIKQRKVDATVAFSLGFVVLGALMSLVTGDPRVLLVRDSWLFGALGLWVLGSLFTSKPFMLVAARAVVTAKVGAAGAQEWEDRWHTEAGFRRHIRVLTAVWGAGFALDAVVRVVLAYTLPIDAVPLVTGLQWVVVLGVLFGFHYWYVTKNGLKV